MYCEICGKWSGKYPLCKECYYENEDSEKLEIEEEDTENENEENTSSKLVCPICGEPTRVYMGNARKDRLCGKHADMLKAGELVLDERGKFILPKTEEETSKSADVSDLTCIICGEPSNGKHFCLKCYRKYHERTISVEIKGCTEFTLTDAYGNKDTKTANGLYVRSLSEKII